MLAGPRTKTKRRTLRRVRRINKISIWTCFLERSIKPSLKLKCAKTGLNRATADTEQSVSLLMVT